MTENPNPSEKLLSLRAKLLYELIKSASLAYQELNDQIDDEIESSEDFDQHPLASYVKNAYSVIKKSEQLLSTELIYDVNGELKTELEKLIVLDGLKGNKNPLRAIFNRVALKK